MSLFSTSLLALLFQYRYLILFPITVIEGPVATMTAGFLSSLGVMNIFLAFIVTVLGDTTSDVFFFSLGILGGKWGADWKFLRRFNFESKKEKFVKMFDKRGGRVLIISKFTHALAGIILMGAGYAGVNKWSVLRYSLFGAILKSIFLVSVGYLAGESYLSYAGYLESGAIILSVIIIVFVLVTLSLSPDSLYRLLGMEDELGEIKNDLR